MASRTNQVFDISVKQNIFLLIKMERATTSVCLVRACPQTTRETDETWKTTTEIERHFFTKGNTAKNKIFITSRVSKPSNNVFKMECGMFLEQLKQLYGHLKVLNITDLSTMNEKVPCRE